MVPKGLAMKYLGFCLLVFLSFTGPLAWAQTFDRQIQSSSDDAEEKFDGSNVTTTSSDIEMVYDSWNSQGLQTLGLRFDNITIPANSLITNAYIQFTADESTSGNVTLTIKGEDVANSSTFSASSNNISNRPTTTASVVWSSIPSWADNQAGVAQRSPDLSTIVTEVMGSNGWQHGNPITFIITGTGNSSDYRKSFSYDEDANKAAKLVIHFTSLSNVDLAVSSIVVPSNVNYPNAANPVQVEVTSYGNLAATSYDVSYSINGNLIATEPGTVTLNAGQSDVFTFAQTADLSALGTYDISAEVTILNDEDSINDAMSKTISVINAVDPLFFSQGSSWRYWDDPADPGATWHAAGYNDAAWTVGLGQFGFGEGDEQTVLNGGTSSYYFRKQVDIPDVNTLNEVYMHLVHDDAAIIFVNGQEVARSELMPLGTITHATAARQTNNSSTENDLYTYKVDPSHFVSGINTIAVSVRNRSASDGDLSFDCAITPTYTYDQDGPYVSYSGGNIIVEEITPAGLVSNTYTTSAGLQLTCTLPHMGTSFSFSLKPQITTEASIYPSTPSKFLTVSDFDGHIEGFTMLLRGEGIIDQNFNWIYGDGHLIISGDLFDRGFHITECMWLLYKLESEAEAAGGKVHLIIGNHEMFNLTDDWRYVEVKYFNDAHLMGKRMSELYDADTELGRWLRSKNIIEKVGHYAFTHGGVSPQVSALNLTYDQMNDYGRAVMNGAACVGACATVTGSNGVYWYRGMADEDLTQLQVDDIVTGIDAERIIIGHTKDNSVRSLYDGRVLAIDMYHVDNFLDGYMEALQFELGCFYKFRTDDVTQTYTLLDACDTFATNLMELNGEGQLQIYPNPTAGTLNIKLPDNMQGDYNLRIVDQQGKVVSTQLVNAELSSLSVSEFAAGKYILVLQNSETTITGHFIIKSR